MSLYSKQKWYCNNCGIEQYSVPHKATLADKHYSTCSFDCSKEMTWKNTLSIMGQEYYPQPKEKQVMTKAGNSMKRKERVLLESEDIKEAILWRVREEFNIPDDYKFDLDVKIKIDAPCTLDSWGTIEATLEWEEDK